ncbi:MAG: TlpA family protein disulfide reductase [Phycisphaerales bacterium JB064]
MKCCCGKNGNLIANVGAAVLILGAAVATSKGLVTDEQDGNMQQQTQEKQSFTLETLLTRDLTYATPGNARYDEAWDKIQSQLGKAAPSFTIGEWQSLDEDMKGGDIKSMRGEIVVIDFWGTWCPPCRAAMPKNYEMAKKYADKDVRFVGICNTRGSETMMETAEANNGQFAMAADQDDKTKEAYGVQWWPYYVVVDREGIVRAAGVRSDHIGTVVDRLLELQPPKDKEEGEAPSTVRRRR